MLRRLFALLLALATSALLAGCVGSGSSQTNKNPSPTITSIALTPQNSAVTVGKTLQFSAQATYSDGSTKDITSTAAWAISDSNVGTVNAGVVTGVKIGVVSVAAGSGSVKATTLVNVTTKAFNQGSLNGFYGFTLTAETSLARFEVGSIKADGEGNFSGIEDVNAAAGVSKAVAVTGTYKITADGRGTLTMNSAGQPARTFHFVLSANSASASDNNGQIIQFDKAGTAAGVLLKEDPTTFKNSGLANHTYVFRLGGLDSTQNPLSSVGEFSVDSSGATVSSGEQDENDNGTINSGAGSASAQSISGSIGSIDPNSGRATLTLTVGSNTSDFAIYVVSASQMEIVGLDAAPNLCGEAELQVSPLPSSPSAGGYTLATEIGGVRGQYWIMGQFQAGSAGQITGLIQHQDGGLVLNYANPGGGLSVGTNGRGLLQENTTQGARTFTVYAVSAARLYVLQTDDAHADSGIAELQQPGPDGFSTGTLNNSFVLSAADTSDGNLGIVGELVADGAGHLTGIVDVSQPQAGNPSQLAVSTVALAASYSQPQANGQASGAANASGAGIQNFLMYLGSSSKALLLGISPTDVNGRITVQ
ncbi:MAG: Ig-like domain-containing protein [Chlamydiota bacterium]